MMPDRTIYSLLDLTQSIRKVIADRFVSAFWVMAEMNKLNYYVHSGHCFPELLEKQDGKVVAQMRSTLWRDDYTRIKTEFREATGQPLTDGVKILFLARISFDPIYGLSLRILDIDPAYTLGDLEREKRETIARLSKEGIIENNKKRSFPWIPKKIAIISVESSKGLADFLQILRDNPWGYRYQYTLFPSLLQGDKAVDTLTRQLARIGELQDNFDVVAIIRGGGDDIGLSCFNHYRLARAVAEFPLPVLSGIGHATNETVTEMITYYNAITPSRLAEYLIQCFHNVSVPLSDAEKIIREYSIKQIKNENEQLTMYATGLHNLTTAVLKQCSREIQDIRIRIRQEATHSIRREHLLRAQLLNNLIVHSELKLKESKRGLNEWQQGLANQTKQLLSRQNDSILHMHNMMRSLHPDNVLRRGYSITLYKGAAVTDAKDVKPGDNISTRLYSGTLESTIKQTCKEDRHE